MVLATLIPKFMDSVLGLIRVKPLHCDLLEGVGVNPCEVRTLRSIL